MLSCRIRAQLQQCPGVASSSPRGDGFSPERPEQHLREVEDGCGANRLVGLDPLSHRLRWAEDLERAVEDPLDLHVASVAEEGQREERDELEGAKSVRCVEDQVAAVLRRVADGFEGLPKLLDVLPVGDVPVRDRVRRVTKGHQLAPE